LGQVGGRRPGKEIPLFHATILPGCRVSRVPRPPPSPPPDATPACCARTGGHFRLLRPHRGPPSAPCAVPGALRAPPSPPRVRPRGTEVAGWRARAGGRARLLRPRWGPLPVISPETHAHTGQIGQ